MKHLALLMAIVGFAATGCAQNRVLGTHARRGGTNMHIARTQTKPKVNLRKTFDKADAQQNESDIELAMYGVRCRNCNTCKDDVCCGSTCDDTCCDTCDTSCGCPTDCSDDCCGDSGCCSNGYCSVSDRCSACGGQGCGLCQRLAGRVASGFCPHSGGYPEAYNFRPSPPSGQVAYPYYTVRGPRDFLRNNPPSIGPY